MAEHVHECGRIFGTLLKETTLDACQVAIEPGIDLRCSGAMVATGLRRLPLGGARALGIGRESTQADVSIEK